MMLALNGGTPEVKKRTVPWPQITARDEEALRDAVEAGNYGSGKLRSRFEERFAASCGVPYCFAVANGTVSLELILRGFGIGFGDEVILPPYTFVATFSSIVYTGATPVFADIDPGTYNLSPTAVEEKITAKTRAIVAVAVGGCPPALHELEEIAKKHHVRLIVDAAQGVGAVYDGKRICAYGDAASVSCQNTKNLTCGEGGMITTHDGALAEKLQLMLSGGVRDGKYVSIAQEHGINEFQASLLLSQYEKLDAEMYLREKNAAYLSGRLNGLDFVRPMVYDDRIDRHAYHLFLLRFDRDRLAARGIDRDLFIKALAAEGVPISSGYKPLYRFPCVTALDTERMIGGKIDVSPLPVCERASFEEGAWLPQTTLLMRRSEIDAIANAFLKVWEHADTLKAMKGGNCHA